MNTLSHQRLSTTWANERGGWLRWPQVLSPVRAPVLLAMVALVFALTLLVAFQQVVTQGLQKGELRHRAVAAHADAVWRCNFLRDAVQRQDCHAQLGVASLNAASPLQHPR